MKKTKNTIIPLALSLFILKASFHKFNVHPPPLKPPSYHFFSWICIIKKTSHLKIPPMVRIPSRIVQRVQEEVLEQQVVTLEDWLETAAFVR